METWTPNTDTLLRNYYKSFIRPHFEYTSVCFDNITAQQAILLEKSQRKAAIACTRAYQRTPNRLLLKEIGWLTLEQRREKYTDCSA